MCKKVRAKFRSLQIVMSSAVETSAYGRIPSVRK